MNPTLKALAQVCRKKRIEEKLLFVPSHRVGHQLGEALSRAVVPWLNLRPVPVAAHAEERALPEMASRGLRRIHPHEQLLLVERLLLEDPVLSGGYFAGAASLPGVVRALWQSVHELRMAGLGPEDVREDAFVVPGKGEAVQRLLGAYERVLEEERLLDEAGLLRVALGVEEAERAAGGRVVMALAGMGLHPLEKRYVEQVAKGALRVIGEQGVPGLPRPRWLLEGSGSEGNPPSTDLDRLRWLWAPEEAPPAVGDGTVSLFHAAGESNEVREVLRRVLAQGLPLDDVELLYTREAPYASLIRDLARSLDLPVTLAGGVPVAQTRPGRALLFFLEWQKEDFLQRPLLRLLAGGYLDLERLGFEGEVPSFGRAAALVRKAGIGWGRARYPTCLESLTREYRVRAEARAPSRGVLAAGGIQREEMHLCGGARSGAVSRDPGPGPGAPGRGAGGAGRGAGALRGGGGGEPPCPGPVPGVPGGTGHLELHGPGPGRGPGGLSVIGHVECVPADHG